MAVTRPARHARAQRLPAGKAPRTRGYDLFGMVSSEFDVPDAPGCSLLGLAVDRRTRYTFPHPGHRCHATGPPGAIEPGHQSTFCLSTSSSACVRYQAWQRLAATDRPVEWQRPAKRGQPATRAEG
jgi:hypothetical protein